MPVGRDPTPSFSPADFDVLPRPRSDEMPEQEYKQYLGKLQLFFTLRP